MIRLIRQGFLSPPAVKLQGQKIYIRPPQARDWQAWADLRRLSRSFLTPWEPSWPDDSLTRGAFLRRLRRQVGEWRDDEGYSFLVFQRDTDMLVGGIGLSYVRRGVAQTATMGYWVGQPHARHGYTSEAAMLLVDFAFSQLGLHRIEAACLPSNRASRSLLERIGCHHEGYARSYLKIDGSWRDHALYAILREDWPA